MPDVPPPRLADAPPSAPVIVWLRRDLRLADNVALAAAVAARRPVVPVYVFDTEPAARAMGGAARWWLHGSLSDLAARLAALGSPLVLRRGPARSVIPALADELGAAGVVWNRTYDPFSVERDAAVKTALRRAGRAGESYGGHLLFEPWAIRTGADQPYRVFTPFWRACREHGLPQDLIAAPARLDPPTAPAAGDALGDWALRPTAPDWASGLQETWRPGETDAADRLETFLADRVAAYPEARDRPAEPGTSRLSPHLAFGEISPRRVAARTLETAARTGAEGAAAKFLSEIGWREFSYALLFNNPELASRNFQSKFDAFPWRDDAADLEAWRRGRTGYPIVDAGLRELWTTGWMHNRVRMITASFLVKHLLIDWRAGEDWFWDTLVDADPANNAAGWQWVAGSGADAAPYFRIFNPITQGERFDPSGDYIRRWVPEIAHRAGAALFAPGPDAAPAYPDGVVDHKAARARALAAFESLKASA